MVRRQGWSGTGNEGTRVEHDMPARSTQQGYEVVATERPPHTTGGAGYEVAVVAVASLDILGHHAGARRGFVAVARNAAAFLRR